MVQAQRVLKLLAVTLGSLSIAGVLPAMGAEPSVLRARDFLDGIGMNVKFKDVGSAYVDEDRVVKRLKFMGIKLVREGFPARELTPRQLEAYHAFAKGGGRFTFIVHNEKSIDETVEDIAAFERAHPGSVRAVEGPNELNNWPITYKGQGGAAGAKAYMADLYKTVKADPTLGPARVAVYGATSWPSISTMSDYANIHSYERNGYSIRERMRLDLESELNAYASDSVSPPGAKPQWVITETGYHTWLGAGYYEGVDPILQAKYGLTTILNAADLGAREIDWYQLVDAWGVPESGEEAFGVFDHLGKPKPLALALHNLTTLLADDGATAKTFTPRPVAYSLSSNLETDLHNGVYHLQLQKSNGRTAIAVWREGLMWDMDADVALQSTPVLAKLDFAVMAKKVEVYDPVRSASPISVFADVKTVDLTVEGAPLIVLVD